MKNKKDHDNRNDHENEEEQPTTILFSPKNCRFYLK
jgi:hypothetical protein